MSNLLIAAIAALARQSKAAFVQQTCDLEGTQSRFLRSLLRVQQRTVLGQHYKLNTINPNTIDRVEAFRDRVPIHTYKDYAPYVERIASGEDGVLTADPVIYLNTSSGSTGQQKLIPVTRRSRNATERATLISTGFAVDAAARYRRSLGRTLLTSSAQSYGHTASGIHYGPVSVSNLKTMNRLYHMLMSHPFEALQVDDVDARHYVCLLFALRNSSLGMIGANFPVLALRLATYLEQFADDLIWDLKTGTIAPWVKIMPDLRQALERQLSPMPDRATALRHILREEGHLTPQRAWQQIGFIVTARGGTSNFYLERFPHYFGDTPVFGGTYASAEAVFGIHRDFNTDAVIPAICSAFYEFIPESQWDVSQPQTQLPHELTVGDRYRILVTNYNGFYRYDIGDVVEIEGFYHQAPLMRFCHRRGGFLSSISEKTTEYHVVQVMKTLMREFNLPLENFCVTLSDDEIPARYLVHIEVMSGHTLRNAEAFLNRFEQELQQANPSYAVKRPALVPSPRLLILETGSFATVRQHLLQRGVVESQLKFPHVVSDRRLLTGVSVKQVIQLADDAA